MAAETPPHRERRELADAIHLLDRPMAPLALHTRDDVLTVVEVNVVGKVVNLHPRDGPLVLRGLLQLLDLRRLLLQHAVAVHADVRRGDPGVTAGPRARMAIQARDL